MQSLNLYNYNITSLALRALKKDKNNGKGTYEFTDKKRNNRSTAQASLARLCTRNFWQNNSGSSETPTEGTQRFRKKTQYRKRRLQWDTQRSRAGEKESFVGLKMTSWKADQPRRRSALEEGERSAGSPRRYFCTEGNGEGRATLLTRYGLWREVRDSTWQNANSTWKVVGRAKRDARFRVEASEAPVEPRSRPIPAHRGSNVAREAPAKLPSGQSARETDERGGLKRAPPSARRPRRAAAAAAAGVAAAAAAAYRDRPWLWQC